MTAQTHNPTLEDQVKELADLVTEDNASAPSCVRGAMLGHPWQVGIPSTGEWTYTKRAGGRYEVDVCWSGMELTFRSAEKDNAASPDGPRGTLP